MRVEVGIGAVVERLGVVGVVVRGVVVGMME